jgi:hypothetical protein
MRQAELAEYFPDVRASEAFHPLLLDHGGTWEWVHRAATPTLACHRASSWHNQRPNLPLFERLVPMRQEDYPAVSGGRRHLSWNVALP